MVHVAIADDIADRLDQLARRRGVTLEVVVNETLAEVLEAPSVAAARERLRQMLAEEGGGMEEEEAVELALRVKHSA